ncbi:MAG: roadblock/LC7 domain-containing protein [Wenzhouxiangella sp.]|nr:roadblock/LC7 domain-containing protein [Wenzhouxiangella sp.]
MTFSHPYAAEHPKGPAVRSVLRGLTGSNRGHGEAAAAISSDGMIISSVLQDGVDADRFAAMSASLLALAQRAISETRRGLLKQLLIEGTDGAVLLVQAGDNAVLAVSTPPGALIGKIFLEARSSAEKLRQSLE